MILTKSSPILESKKPICDHHFHVQNSVFKEMSKKENINLWISLFTEPQVTGFLENRQNIRLLKKVTQNVQSYPIKLRERES